ncbi:MAG: spoIIIJ-associated protein [Candidatus Paceibacteria bacterium]|jgi:spoIIIJ-associated protein
MSFEKELENTIKELVTKIPFNVEDISISFDQNNTDLWCSLTSSDSRHLIGKDGETLFSLNHILKKLVDNKIRNTDIEPLNFILDINGYQKKKVEDLYSKVYMLAERVRYFKSSIEAPPMTSFDRRLVHDYLSREKNIRTESKGEGFDRKVVIYYSEDKK